MARGEERNGRGKRRAERRRGIMEGRRDKRRVRAGSNEKRG